MRSGKLKKNPNFWKFISIEEGEIIDKETYQESLRNQKRLGQTSLCCVNCGENHPRVIEMHHPYGKNNSEEVLPFCKNCHAMITYEQNKLSPKARSKNASPEQKRDFVLVSIGAALLLFGTKLIDMGTRGC
jgi:hypothetical protein